MDFNKIYDLIALRVIVPAVKDCYATLGEIHSRYKPIIGRIKDYIATPKPNGYQSLHTTVLTPEGKYLEIQIRTQKMHEEAENGIAAHWFYSENKDLTLKLPKELEWINQLRELQVVNEKPELFLEQLKDDIFQSRIYVLTPAGDVKDLPEQATPIDFSFLIHTDIGYKYKGAKVNGRMVAADYQLKNGDLVQIITSKKYLGPSRDWLEFVKTNLAKNKIKSWFRRLDRNKNLETGKELLNHKLIRLEHPQLAQIPKEKINKLAREFNFKTSDNLLIAVGEGTILTDQVIEKLISEGEILGKNQKVVIEEAPPRSITVADQGGILTHLAKCCQPKENNEIVGLVTLGQGVSVHRTSCKNFNRHKQNKQKIIRVSWQKKEHLNIPIELIINERPNLLIDITKEISDLGIYIIQQHTLTNHGGQSKMLLTLEIKNILQLNKVLNRLEKIEGVKKVIKK